ncbi:MAG: PQQ-binding-like beta-propeller repeat protein [Phycisphaerae bacterium]
MLPTLVSGGYVWLAAITITGQAPVVGDAALSDRSLQRGGLAIHWVAHLPLAERDQVGRGYLINDSLYVSTAGGTFFSVHAGAGLIRWGARLTEPEYTIYRPSHIHMGDGGRLVVITTTDRLYVVERYTGEIIHSFEPPVVPGSPAVGLGNTIYLGSPDARFYALLWGSKRTQRLVTLWQVVTGDPVTASPVLYRDDIILFGSRRGMVYSCRAADKVHNWSFKSSGGVLGEPVVEGTGVYFADLGRSVYKLDAETGALAWQKRLPYPLVEGPIVTSQTVYQYCPGYGLVAIDAATGMERWRHTDGRTLAAHAAGRDVVFSRDRQLQVLDSTTGEVLASLDAYPAEQALPNGQTDAVYLLDPAGGVMCIRPASVPHLRPMEVNTIRAKLNTPPTGEQRAAAPVHVPDQEAEGRFENDPLRSRRDLAR